MSRKEKYIDLAERVAWTFVEAFSAVLIVEQDWTPDALKVAATAGAIAILKVLVGWRTNPDTGGQVVPPGV